MEEWKTIEGYENKYLISNKGRVKSLYDKNGNYRKYIIQPRKKAIYLYVNLYKNGKCKTKKIHRLVAETFIPNPNNLHCVNHIDGNKHNNNVNNLEWCTYSENTNKAIEIGLFNKEVLFKNGKDNIMYNKHNKEHPSSVSILQFSLDNKFIKQWNSIKEAEKKLNISHISDCCGKKRKTAGGYIWKYEREVYMK